MKQMMGWLTGAAAVAALCVGAACTKSSTSGQGGSGAGTTTTTTTTTHAGGSGAGGTGGAGGGLSDSPQCMTCQGTAAQGSCGTQFGACLTKDTCTGADCGTCYTCKAYIIACSSQCPAGSPFDIICADSLPIMMDLNACICDDALGNCAADCAGTCSMGTGGAGGA